MMRARRQILLCGLWFSPLLAWAQFVDVSTTNLPQSALTGRSMDVEFADIDGDGDQDAFVAIENERNLWLRNDGSFRFTVATDAIPASTQDSEDVIPGDFDRDGDIDVIFVSEDTPINEYYLNDGAGNFSASPNPLPSNTVSNAGIAADLDGDNDLDLIIARNNARELVMLNNGAGVFSDVSNSWMPNIVDVTQDVELADIDGDGDLDLLTANEPSNNNGRNRLYMRVGNTFVDESAARIPLRATYEETREVAYGDVDGDSDLDLVYGNADFASPGNADRILINNGSGVFTDESATRLPNVNWRTLDVDLSDVDGDRDLDLLIANFGVGIKIHLNNGSGVFTEATNQVLGASASARNTIDVELIEGAGARWIYEGGFNAVDRLLRAPRDRLFTNGFE